MLHFVIGQVYYFIRINYLKDPNDPDQHFVPWKDKLTRIIVKKLICVEHHRVPTNLGNGSQEDGYIFHDETNRRFLYQYPVANYLYFKNGHYEIVHADKTAEPESFEFDQYEEGEEREKFELVDTVLNTIKLSIDNFTGERHSPLTVDGLTRLERREYYEKHYQSVIQAIEQTYNVTIKITGIHSILLNTLYLKNILTNLTTKKEVFGYWIYTFTPNP